MSSSHLGTGYIGVGGSSIDLPLLAPESASRQSTPNPSETPPHWARRFSDFSAIGEPDTPPPRYASTHAAKRYEGTRLQSSARQLYLDWGLATGTVIWCLITAIYAYNATLERPRLNIVFTDTRWTLAFVSALSQISMFFVGELVQATFERARWTLASRSKGLLLTNFLGMSRATSLVGVLGLLVLSGKGGQTSTIREKLMDKRQMWILQRLLLFILRAALGIILLTDLTFKNTYAPYVTKPILSGMPTFNASLTVGDGSNNDYIRRAAIQNFILSPLAPYRVTLPNEMINCTDSSCLAVRIHWNIEYTAVPPPTWKSSDPLPEVTADWQTQFDPDNPWTTFIVHNASTVQMEFSYPQQNVVFVGDECQMYGYPYLAMEVCMKQGSMPHQIFFAAGVCQRIEQSDCFTNQTWAGQLTRPTHVSLYRVNSDVVYDRKDDNILDSTLVSTPVPTAFDTEGLFQLYNATYGLADFSASPVRSNEVVSTIRYHAVQQATAFLEGDVGYKGAAGDEDHFWTTYAVRALIIEPYMDDTNSVADVAFLTTGSSANNFSRLIIPPAQMFGFLVIVVLILTWSFTLITWSLVSKVISPNNSLYPEIDFGSKCVQSEHERRFSRQGERSIAWIQGIGGLLAPLSNATSVDVARDLAGITIHTGATRKSVMDLPHVILTTDANEADALVVGQKYR